MTLDSLIIRSCVFLVLTLISSWVGDDDVAYTVMGRKPTSQEGIARIRYVLVKFFAMFYGGALLAFVAVQQIVQRIFLLNVSKFEYLCLQVLCMILLGLFIGVVQNWIRSLQGRKKRPICDVALARYNSNQWKKWSRGKIDP